MNLIKTVFSLYIFILFNVNSSKGQSIADTSKKTTGKYDATDRTKHIIYNPPHPPVEDDYTFFVPNAFTPNGDGINDDFFGKGDNIKEFEMIIYDRWGTLFFYSKDIKKHWDGKMRGTDKFAPDDVYVYIINIKDNAGQSHKYMGSVSLVK